MEKMKITRKFIDENGKTVYQSTDTHKNVEKLLFYLWNKYVNKSKLVTKVTPNIKNDTADIKFEFCNNTKEEFTGIPVQWGLIDFYNLNDWTNYPDYTVQD